MRESELLNPPRQRRSAETLQRILTATRQLLTERDFTEISVDDIVERAKSSKGSFYNRFADKDSLLVYLLREEHQKSLTAWSDFLNPPRWHDQSLGDFLGAFVDRLSGIYRGRPTIMRAYAGQVFGGDGEIRNLSTQLTRHVLAGVRVIVLKKKDEVRHPDPEVATAFLLTALITLLPPLFLSPTQELFPEPIAHDRIAEELRTLIRSYLT